MIAQSLRPLVLKFGGELLEDRAHLTTVVSAVATLAATEPVAIVHGGGKEIDAALKTAGIEKHQVDGLRITDAATLDIVVAVLAGSVNTRFVAALNGAGVAAVGLTGADASSGLSVAAAPHRTVDGRLVDLGRVGVPRDDMNPRLLQSLVRDRFVPVMACIGVTADGQLLNVNADTLAAHVAVTMRARRLVVAGTTPGVLGPDNVTIPNLDVSDIHRLVESGTATAGMIAKLRACEHALARGVEDIVIVDGRDRDALVAAATGDPAGAGTLLTGERVSQAGVTRWQQ